MALNNDNVLGHFVFYSLSPICTSRSAIQMPDLSGHVRVRDFPLLDAPCRMTATDDTVPNRYNITPLLCGGLTLSYALIPTTLKGWTTEDSGVSRHKGFNLSHLSPVSDYENLALCIVEPIPLRAL